MSSEFEEAMAEGFDEALDFLGAKEFSIGRLKFSGDIDLFDSDRSLMSEGGGLLGDYSGTIVATKAQFLNMFPAPLERSIHGKRLTISGRTFRVGKAIEDAISLTLHLNNPNGKK